MDITKNTGKHHIRAKSGGTNLAWSGNRPVGADRCVRPVMGSTHILGSTHRSTPTKGGLFLWRPLRLEFFILYPVHRVGLDVQPDGIHFPGVSNNPVVIIALPKGSIKTYPG